MDTTLVIILISVIVIGAIGFYFYMRERRSRTLKARFGPEYERMMQETGNRGRAENALEKRAKRIEKYNIRSLTPEERETLSREWQHTQALFVDDPVVAIHEGDRLICDAMRRTGYPMADFDLRTEDLSVEHPRMVKNYRAAHEIAVASERGDASTEDLRQAMVYYRDLFDELLETQPAGHGARR